MGSERQRLIHQKNRLARKIRRSADQEEQPLHTHPVLDMQQRFGNQQVQNMLAQPATTAKASGLPPVRGLQRDSLQRIWDDENSGSSDFMGNGNHTGTYGEENLQTRYPDQQDEHHGLHSNPYDDDVPSSNEMPTFTKKEIQGAINFNATRYSFQHTKTLQKFLNVGVTGFFNEETVLAAARLQHVNSLKADGKIGDNTFRLIDRLQKEKGDPDDAANSLILFEHSMAAPKVEIVPAAGGTFTFKARRNFQVRVRFSERGNTSQYEYRQYIKGIAQVTRGETTQDMSYLFPIPGGNTLMDDFQEDGNDAWTGREYYGRRSQPGASQSTNEVAENHYVNNEGQTDQRNGSQYRGDDTPKMTINGLQSGDVVRFRVDFEGRILRGGAELPQHKKTWQAFDVTMTVP